MTEELISLQLIDDNPYQDRGSYDDIPELGRSIAVNGIEQKPKARQVGKRYQLKFGHRRKRAFDWLRDHWQAEAWDAEIDEAASVSTETKVKK